MAAKKAELEIEQKIARESAELTKALNLRQEGMRELAVHRSRAKEDKRMLAEEKKVCGVRVCVCVCPCACGVCEVCGCSKF